MGARRRTRRIFGALIVSVLALGSLVAITAPAGAQDQNSGTIRIAAEEEPFCADWISSCGGSAWANWELGNLTMPQPISVDVDGSYLPGAMSVDMPTLEPGPPMKVTYRIRPEAVWSDGEPITSTDFEYTWKQIVNGKNIYDTTGYIDIDSVDTTDPKVAVVTFKRPVAAWKDLFGGFYFVLPSHLLDGKSRHKEMKDGYAFSAGPWELQGGKQGWKKGKSITLVPNDAYWGTKPTIKKVIFQLIPESSAELEAVETGQVSAAYPLPIDGALDRVEATDNLDYVLSFGNQYEAFYFNADVFPLKSQAVRQAIAYATDRQAIVDAILKPAINQGRVLQSFVVPTFKEFFDPSFEKYSRNLDMVDQLMTGDGWKKNGDDIWEKGGRTASFVVNSTSGNEQRQLNEQLWQSQLREAGFDMKFKNLASDPLFGVRLPNGKYDVALYASVGTPDPGQCLVFCSKNIPSKKNKFGGQNWSRSDDPTIDESCDAVDSTLDETVRVQQAQTCQRAIADYMAALPLFQTPTLFIFNTDQLSGRLVDNTVMGPFFYMNEWVLK